MSRLPVVVIASDERAELMALLENEGIEVVAAADAQQALTLIKEMRALMPGSRVPLERIEQAHIERVLRRNKGNKSLAAQELGIDRTTLYNKLRKYA